METDINMLTRQQIAVMQTFTEGKKIWVRFKRDTFNNGWATVTTPTWDWSLFDYRIDLPCRSYRTAEELLQAQRQHGHAVKLKYKSADINASWVISPHPGDYVIIMRQYEYDTITFNELLERYVWASDNTPCGMAEGTE